MYVEREAHAHTRAGTRVRAHSTSTHTEQLYFFEDTAGFKAEHDVTSITCRVCVRVCVCACVRACVSARVCARAGMSTDNDDIVI